MTDCRICAKPFQAATTLHTICSVRCLNSVQAVNRKADKAKAKAERADLKRRRDAIKPRAKWLKEAQQEFNTGIRQRDEHLGCISCGAMTGKMNAGHYLSVGARPELRFDPANVHKQCERCNTYLHGNLIPYRAELIRRVGLAEVERLEGPHAPLKLTIDDLRAIRDENRRKVKEAA